MLDPVCSLPVFDAKAKKELVIMDISETEAPVEGGKKIILLCEKVLREDVKVRFWDPPSGWEGWGQFSAQVRSWLERSKYPCVIQYQIPKLLTIFFCHDQALKKLYEL